MPILLRPQIEGRVNSLTQRVLAWSWPFCWTAHSPNQPSSKSFSIVISL